MGKNVSVEQSFPPKSLENVMREYVTMSLNRIKLGGLVDPHRRLYDLIVEGHSDGYDIVGIVKTAAEIGKLDAYEEMKLEIDVYEEREQQKKEGSKKET